LPFFYLINDGKECLLPTGAFFFFPPLGIWIWRVQHSFLDGLKRAESFFFFLFFFFCLSPSTKMHTLVPPLWMTNFSPQKGSLSFFKQWRFSLPVSCSARLFFFFLMILQFSDWEGDYGIAFFAYFALTPPPPTLITK